MWSGSLPSHTRRLIREASLSTNKHALLSVSDKSGIVEFAEGLDEAGWSLISTGGTARVLKGAGLAVRQVSDCTGFPEMMEGRLKTLHPVVHGGILGRRETDVAVMDEHGMVPIDLVCVNLYPFEEVVGNPDSSEGDAIENIDIGGPAMIRSAAKNHRNVLVVVDPTDYCRVLRRLAADSVDADFRRRLAAKAFRRTAWYDAGISSCFSGSEELPDEWVLPLRRRASLRYGENPHQRAGYYSDSVSGRPEPFRQVHGVELSFNNIADMSAAVNCASELMGTGSPACVIVKHANPCGAALAEDPAVAYERAFACDPVSAYGGVLCFNRPLDRTLVDRVIGNQFVELVAAPQIEPGAVAVANKRRNLRLVEVAVPPERQRWHVVPAIGGLLIQQPHDGSIPDGHLKVVTQNRPDGKWDDLFVASRVCAWVKSNAIVLAKDGQTIGIGAGQANRVASCRLSVMNARKAGLDTEGAVMASDGFFPFRDSLDIAAEAGVAGVVQPGGSIRDRDVIAAAEQHGMWMVFTGRRHFRH